jgi:hypothetical protein
VATHSTRQKKKKSFKKVLIGPKNFLLSKFENGYQKYAEFHADSKTVEKNAINLLAKKLQSLVEHSRVFVPLYYCFTKVVSK